MISTGQLIVILVVVLLLFGTKRLRNIGGDLGAAIKGFKQSMGEGEQEAAKKDAPPNPQLSQDGGRVIDQTAQKQDETKKS